MPKIIVEIRNDKLIPLITYFQLKIRIICAYFVLLLACLLWGLADNG